jgi:hypothetical protein
VLRAVRATASAIPDAELSRFHPARGGNAPFATRSLRVLVITMNGAIVVMIVVNHDAIVMTRLAPAPPAA